MDHRVKCLEDFTVEELDRELKARIARARFDPIFDFDCPGEIPERNAIMAQVRQSYHDAVSIPLDDSLGRYGMGELANLLLFKIGKLDIDGHRGVWEIDERLDYYMIDDQRVKKNADSVAMVCKKNDLTPSGNGFSTLRTKNYGEAFHLYSGEPFTDQPIAANALATAFLVKDDMVATAGHCLDKINMDEHRIVFGYKMTGHFGEGENIARIPHDNIYSPVKLNRRNYNREQGIDWELVKLDRKVKGRTYLKLADAPGIANRYVYVLGHPCGLPLKYAPGPLAGDENRNCFSANLDIYSGNSGSPVFCQETHQIVGMVIHGHKNDFRWVGGDKGFVSVVYPDSRGGGGAARCMKVSAFLPN